MLAIAPQYERFIFLLLTVGYKKKQAVKCYYGGVILCQKWKRSCGFHQPFTMRSLHINFTVGKSFPKDLKLW